MIPGSQISVPTAISGGHSQRSDWGESLAAAIRDPDELVYCLNLPEECREPARRAAKLFPLMVTQSYLQRMTPGDPDDPLLRQVLPIGDEFAQQPGFVTDAVDDETARRAPGLLQKYHGRALLIATGSCAIHCRYCFRRHYPYGDEPRRKDEWTAALEVIAEDESLSEVILSGGDPLMLTDSRLEFLINRISDVPHIRRLRIHSRLPIVLPNRITDQLLSTLAGNTSLQPIMVVHANHPAEIQTDCLEALQKLVRVGIPTLNQSVLLHGVNDDSQTLIQLSESLINLGVIPYYLHQLDQVAGAAHFSVSDDLASRLIDDLRSALPGYAVPKLVREIPGEKSKTPVGPI